MVIYHYRRYYVLDSEAIKNLEDALERAKNDIDENTAAPDKIVLENGTGIDREAILKLLTDRHKED